MKWKWICAAIALFLILGIPFAVMRRTTSGGAEEKGVQADETHNAQAIDAEAAAVVNGVAIAGESLDRAYDLQLAFYEMNKALYGLEGEAPTREAVLQAMVEREVLVQEAERLGLGATEKQLSEHFAHLDAQLDTEEAEDTRKMLDAYAESLGLDRTEYREQYEKPLERRVLTVENLYRHVMEKQTEQTAWEAYKESLLKAATIWYPET